MKYVERKGEKMRKRTQLLFIIVNCQHTTIKICKANNKSVSLCPDHFSCALQIHVHPSHTALCLRRLTVSPAHIWSPGLLLPLGFA